MADVKNEGDDNREDTGDVVLPLITHEGCRIYINEADGLPNEHPTLPDELDLDNDDPENDTLNDLPTSIIVTNIHSEVFGDDTLKVEMENLFRAFSEAATFQWLKSFRRLRVNFDNAIKAANARVRLHQLPFYKSNINCYFAQPLTPISAKNLQPPALTKQFLISPPASPPAGWEPREEGEPIINHDLLDALANLNPGESHEVHPPTESQPAIIVHTAQMQLTEEENLKLRIQQTRCPERS